MELPGTAPYEMRMIMASLSGYVGERTAGL